MSVRDVSGVLGLVAVVAVLLVVSMHAAGLAGAAQHWLALLHPSPTPVPRIWGQAIVVVRPYPTPTALASQP